MFAPSIKFISVVQARSFAPIHQGACLEHTSGPVTWVTGVECLREKHHGEPHAAECFDPGIREKLLELASEFREMAEREKSLQVSES